MAWRPTPAKLAAEAKDDDLLNMGRSEHTSGDGVLLLAGGKLYDGRAKEDYAKRVADDGRPATWKNSGPKHDG